VSQIRIVLVGEQDMLQDIIRRALSDDPAFALIAECRSADELPALWERVEADVAVIRPVSADVSVTATPAGPRRQVPAVVGIALDGTQGIVVLDDLSREGLRAAVHAAAELRSQRGKT
jgi:DNA-binding NarL/FixJ family response regulator